MKLCYEYIKKTKNKKYFASMIQNRGRKGMQPHAEKFSVRLGRGQTLYAAHRNTSKVKT